ncbi:hypothetical protein, partial [Actinophytocola sediminis]
RDKWMRRDYGLIEFYSNPSNDGWTCFGFSIQIHRLSNGTDLVPRSLVDRYGQFRSSVSLESMLERFAAIPSSPRLKPDKMTADFGTFNVDGTSSYMTVVRQAGSDVADLAREFGDIWSIEVRALIS